VACVVGERKRHLRDASWRLHVPRPLKERALRLCRTADELHQRWGRSPTTSELAEQLEMGEEVLEGLAAMSSRHEVAPEAREEPEDLLALSGLVAALPELEREVIVLRTFQDLDQDDIAARVGFSQMACLPVAAPRLGPHACPTGGSLSWRLATSSWST
jgi:RNA polymerase sigma-B factor